MRIGGRGCPKCGSHKTWSKNARERGSVCESCGHQWTSCHPDCRGYLLDLHHADGPCVVGCAKCGVPNYIARTWPESNFALAKELRKIDTLEPTLDAFRVKRAAAGKSR